MPVFGNKRMLQHICGILLLIINHKIVEFIPLILFIPVGKSFAKHFSGIGNYHKSFGVNSFYYML